MFARGFVRVILIVRAIRVVVLLPIRVYRIIRVIKFGSIEVVRH